MSYLPKKLTLTRGTEQDDIITLLTFMQSSLPDKIIPHTFITHQPNIYQRGRIASYANAGIAREEISVCLSVCHILVLYQNERRRALTL